MNRFRVCMYLFESACVHLHMSLTRATVLSELVRLRMCVLQLVLHAYVLDVIFELYASFDMCMCVDCESRLPLHPFLCVADSLVAFWLKVI